MNNMNVDQLSKDMIEYLYTNKIKLVIKMPSGEAAEIYCQEIK